VRPTPAPLGRGLVRSLALATVVGMVLFAIAINAAVSDICEMLSH
jgi:hypothetical protein